MRVLYEDCLFEIEISHFGEIGQIIIDRLKKRACANYTPPASIKRGMFRQYLKRKWRLPGSQHQDCYLTYACDVLSKKEAPIIVDVGSGVGTTTLPLGKKYPRSQIYAIEPAPNNVSQLLHNKRLNKLSNIAIISTAIDVKIDLVSLRIDEVNEGGHHLVFDEREALHVCTSPLRNVLISNQISHCDLLKIDTEGFEYNVLHSLEDFRNPQVVENIVLEYNPYSLERNGRTAWDLISLGIESGYRCHVLQTEQEIKFKRDIPNILKNHVLDFVFSPK